MKLESPKPFYLLLCLGLFLQVAVGQPPFLDKLGRGAKAALAVIGNLCGSEPPVACTCRNTDEDFEADENSANGNLNFCAET